MYLHIKKLCRVFACLGLLLSMNFSSQSQQLDSTLLKLGQNFQPEKAFIHYDKSSYFPGETIWYKVYLVEGLYPAEESKNMYVDLIAENGNVLAHYASPLISGISIGQFDIPEDFKGNVIHVRAYTKWMLNFDSSVIYKKEIRIHPKTPQAKQPMPDAITSVTFFPEGGELVAGVINRVAFKANDQWGRPVQVRGSIYEKNVRIDSFKTIHNGMGVVQFTPKPGIEYVAKWKDERGREQSTSLPAIRTSGVSLQVSLEEKKRILQVNVAAGETATARQFHIIGTMLGNKIFSTSGSAAPGAGFRKVISTENVPTGIMVITVFDDRWNAIAERISFINNNDYSFTTGFEVVRWGLNKRARNEIELKLPENFTEGSFSVSVTDANIDHDSSQNIISHLLLNSELKGNVYNSAYYFKDNSLQRQQQLDLVMLTHGWRRFKWEDLTKGKLPEIKFPKDTSYLSLSGKLFGAPKSQLTGTESIVLFLKSKDSISNSQILSINRDGSFGNPDFLFFDTLKVYYQVKSKLFGNSGAVFMENKLSTPNYVNESKRFPKSFPFIFDTTTGYHAKLGKEGMLLQDRLRGNVLETVTVKAKAKTPLQELDDKYTSGLFKSGDSYSFDIMNDHLAMGRLDIFNYLQGRVAGLQVLPGGGGEGPQLSWRGSSPDLFLDERQVDADLLQNIPIDDIALVKVFRPPFVGASFGGAGGAIAVYTKKGGDQRRGSGGLSSNTITGFAPLKEFYSPNYSSFDKRHENKDLRTTLYWNGMLAPNANTKTIKFSFYNNDVSKSFRIIVTGINKEGLLTHMEEIME